MKYTQTIKSTLMSNKENIYALKPDFINFLYNEYIENYQNKKIKDFLVDINEKYGNDILSYCVPGDTKIFLDDDIRYKMNTQPSIYSKKQLSDWDYAYSKLIYTTNTNPGIFRFNVNNEKVSINMIQATDWRVWNYLSLFKLHKYVIKRWGESDDPVRIFIRKLGNGNISRHSILRLYWTAEISNDINRENKLELLETLWRDEDFMTQVTERSTANMKDQILYFLEFCSNPNNETALFKTKSTNGYLVYREFIKLFLADSNISTISNCNKDEVFAILTENLNACL
jgi:hypothetical protein